MVRFLSDAYRQARTLLNDDDGTNWNDFRLHPKAVMAFEELEAELIVAGIPIIQSFSQVLNVPLLTAPEYVQVPENQNYSSGTSYTFDLSTVPNYPQDMILPIWMKERQVGQANQDFVDMVEVDFIPNIDLDVYLHYWCWQGNKILLRGALCNTQVQLRYQRYLPVPQVNTDSLIVPLGQLYIGNRIAALAYQSVGNRQMWLDLTDVANTNLGRILDMNIKELQDLPAKRRPYHRGYGRNRVLRDF
jgi:hypothetical protein